jgi:excisionase family DNA binding protein
MAEKMALSVTEAAEALGISRRSLYNLIKLDGFPVLELGGRRVIPVDLLQEWMRGRVESRQQ